MKINTPFTNIAVIGAGTMGSGIAGQIANSDQEVLLLDIQGETPNSITENAVKKLIKSDPPALMHKTKTELIKIGNIEDDFNKLADCDLIIEAVVERLDIKKNRLIKGGHFEGLRHIGDPQNYAVKYYHQGIDEILLLDTVASLHGRNALHDIIDEITNNIFSHLSL